MFHETATRNGINPAVPRDKKRPKVADVSASNGDVLVDGKQVGRVHGFDVTTFEGARKYKGGAEGIETNMVDLGNNDVLFVSCRISDDERDNPCAITGGVGRFAGARGTVTTKFLGASKGTVRVQVTALFIP